MTWTSSSVSPTPRNSLFSSGRPVNLPVSSANGNVPERNCEVFDFWLNSASHEALRCFSNSLICNSDASQRDV